MPRRPSLLSRILLILGIWLLLGAAGNVAHPGKTVFTGTACGTPPPLGLHSELTGLTTEAGAQAVFPITLLSRPTADVHVHFTSSNPAEGRVDTPELTFTPVNWNGPAQLLKVTGMDDRAADGPQSYLVRYLFETDDPSLDHRGDSLRMTNADDESPGITTSALGGDTTEVGGKASFEVVLNTPPRADVTLDLASTDTTEGTVTPETVTFTAADWNLPRKVTVTGVHDRDHDGNVHYAITFAPTTSDDPDYASLQLADIPVVNRDNDRP